SAAAIPRPSTMPPAASTNAGDTASRIVQRLGVQVRKAIPSILLAVHLYSPNESRDTLYLSNYATLHVKDLLARLLLWQARQCILHAVLGQHLRDVEVSADLERDGNREVAVPGRLTAHVEHVLDAVDFLFEWRRDGAGDGLG